MRIRIDMVNEIAVVQVEGSISQDVVALFRLKLQELLEEKRVKIVLDLGEASYISSVGLALVTAIQGKAAQLGGDLKVARMNYLVRNLFEITNLLKKLDSHETVEEAIASFGSSGA